MPEKSFKKAALEMCGKYTGLFYKWFAQIGVERQIYIHTYKHSHTLLRKQACTHSQPVGTHMVYDKIILIEQSVIL